MSDLLPECLGIILCDQVIEDKRTNKKSYIGAFYDIVASRVPTKHPCMYLVVSLTNCRREEDVAIEISRDTEEGGERVMGLKGRLHGRNPVNVIDLVFELRGIPLTGFGSYTIDVTIPPGEKRIAQRRFFVRELRKPEKREAS